MQLAGTFGAVRLRRDNYSLLNMRLFYHTQYRHVNRFFNLFSSFLEKPLISGTFSLKNQPKRYNRMQTSGNKPPQQRLHPKLRAIVQHILLATTRFILYARTRTYIRIFFCKRSFIAAMTKIQLLPPFPRMGRLL